MQIRICMHSGESQRLKSFGMSPGPPFCTVNHACTLASTKNKMCGSVCIYDLRNFTSTCACGCDCEHGMSINIYEMKPMFRKIGGVPSPLATSFHAKVQPSEFVTDS